MKQRLARGATTAVSLMAVLLLGAMPVFERQAAAQSFQLTVALGSGERACRISWPAIPGQQYQLQRSLDLVMWENVAVVAAQGEPVIQLEVGDPSVRRTFWRVVQLGTEPRPVSGVAASFQLSGSESSALTRIVTEGEQPVTNVAFYDNGVFLGDAVPGMGNSWTFEMVWDSANPRVQHMRAGVTAEDGTTLFVPSRALLLADPSKFVPLHSDGTRGNGEFVDVNEEGRLEPFVFYPEGAGDIHFHTGAHYEFPSGAVLTGDPEEAEIEFTAARFFRSHQDVEPITALPGTRRIKTSAADPAGVSRSLGLPAGAKLQLLWGNIPVEWIAGTLSEAGWAGLKVRPLLGDFAFPATQECAAVTLQSLWNEPTLVVCYHGQWAPFDSGPLFRIPSAEPLKIYLGRSGRVSAHGTVETSFSSGAQVRGSLSWRDPYFILNFQGRNIVIPALASLRRALPANPEECLPDNSATADLDTAALCLSSLRDVYRAVALGGLTEASTGSTEVFAPMAEAKDSTGIALGAWASRLASWPADRPGQVLDAGMLSDLRKVITNASKLAEAAHDLPTALSLLHGFLLVNKHAPSAAGTSGEASELLSALAEAEPRFLASAQRLLEEKISFPPGSELADTVEWLNLLEAELPAAPAARVQLQSLQAFGTMPSQADQDALRNEVVRIALGVKDKFELDTFSRRGIVKGVFNGANNAILAGMTRSELLGFLDEVRLVFALFKGTDTNMTAAQAPPQLPLVESVLQVQHHLAPKHQEFVVDAVQKKDVGKLRAALKERAHIFQVYMDLGMPIGASNSIYQPLTIEMVVALEQMFIPFLASIAPDKRIEHYVDVLGTLADLAFYTGDSSLDDHIASTWLQLSDFNQRLSKLAGIEHCQQLIDLLSDRQDLASRQVQLIRAPLGYEGSHEVPVTGKFESRPSAGRPYITLQLNQAGRYVSGSVQYHGRGTALRRYRLEGWLMPDQPGVVEFAYVRIDAESEQIISAGVLSARTVGQSVEIVLSEGTGGSVGRTEFVQTTNVPVLSEHVVNLLPGTAQEVLLAHLRAPLHSEEIRGIGETITQIKAMVGQFFTNNLSSIEQGILARSIDFEIRDVKKILSLEHVPVLRNQFQRSLSASLIHTEDFALSSWESLLLIYNLRRADMPNTSEMLGIVPANISTSRIYTYVYTVRQNAASAGIGVASIGSVGLEIQVRKTDPEGVTTTFHLAGQLAQTGVGIGLPLGAISSTDSVTVKSTLNYEASDLEGPVTVSSLSAGAALFLGVSLGKTGLILNGRGLLPSVILETEASFSGTIGFQLSAGGDFAAGHLIAAQTFLNPKQVSHSAEPVAYRSRREAAFDASLDFTVDGATISECGWQHLREFVAEFRSIFASPAAEITVFGFTDTTASEQHNLALSQRRADNVKNALSVIVGPLLGVSEERFKAIGLGEEPARTIGGLPDNTDAQAWRRVRVLLNDLVSVDVDSPRSSPVPP